MGNYLDHALVARSRALAAEHAEPGRPALGAFIAIASEAELAEQAAGPATGPWAGQVMALKDLHDVAGFPTTMGSALRLPLDGQPPAKAERDDALARLHRVNGAMILGKTQVPEFGLNSYSANRIAPPSRCPWDLDAYSGGSSGGQAAAVAAGITDAVVGSDGGGSIRIPAAACGLIGLKTGRGRVPAGDGMGDHAQLAVLGPIARTAQDAAKVYDGLAAPNPDVPGGNLNWRSTGAPSYRSAVDALSAARDGNFPWASRRLRVRVSTSSPFESAYPIEVSPQARDGLAAGLEALGELGAQIDARGLEFPEAYPEQFFILWTAGLALDPLEPEQESLLTGLAQHFRSTAKAITSTQLQRSIRFFQALEKDLIQDWAAWDVIVTPALAMTPRPLGWYWEGFSPDDPASADQDYQRQCQYTPWTSVINTIGLPAIVVPTHWATSESGAQVPMGIQLIGQPGSEPELLVLADQLATTLQWDTARMPDWTAGLPSAQ